MSDTTRTAERSRTGERMPRSSTSLYASGRSPLGPPGTAASTASIASSISMLPPGCVRSLKSAGAAPPSASPEGACTSLPEVGGSPVAHLPTCPDSDTTHGPHTRLPTQGPCSGGKKCRAKTSQQGVTQAQGSVKLKLPTGSEHGRRGGRQFTRWIASKRLELVARPSPQWPNGMITSPRSP